MGVKETLVASVPAVKRLLPVMKGLLQERFQEKRSLKDRGVKPLYLIQYKDG